MFSQNTELNALTSDCLSAGCSRWALMTVMQLFSSCTSLTKPHDSKYVVGLVCSSYKRNERVAMMQCGLWCWDKSICLVYLVVVHQPGEQRGCGGGGGEEGGGN